MKDLEFKRNGSGYYDPTAYKAMKNYMEGEEMKQGEVWEIQLNNGMTKEAIVIVDHGNFSSILQLTENNDFGNIEVNCHGVKYTDPRRLQYAFNNNFTSFIRTLKAEEFDQIMDSIADALGLYVEPEKLSNQPEKVVEKIVEVPAISDNAADLAAITLECTKAQAERDVFKGLYEKLLESVMKGGVSHV